MLEHLTNLNADFGRIIETELAMILQNGFQIVPLDITHHQEKARPAVLMSPIAVHKRDNTRMIERFEKRGFAVEQSLCFLNLLRGGILHGAQLLDHAAAVIATVLGKEDSPHSALGQWLEELVVLVNASTRVAHNNSNRKIQITDLNHGRLTLPSNSTYPK